MSFQPVISHHESPMRMYQCWAVVPLPASKSDAAALTGGPQGPMSKGNTVDRRIQRSHGQVGALQMRMYHLSSRFLGSMCDRAIHRVRCEVASHTKYSKHRILSACGF